MSENESRKRPLISASVVKKGVAIATVITTGVTLAAWLGPSKGRHVELSTSTPETIWILDTVTGTVSARTTTTDRSTYTETTKSTDGTQDRDVRVGIPEVHVTTGPGRARIDWTFQNHPGRPAIEWQYKLDNGQWTATARPPQARNMTLWFSTSTEDSTPIERRSIQIRGVDDAGVGTASEAVEFTNEPAVDYSEILYGGRLTRNEVETLWTILRDKTKAIKPNTPDEDRVFEDRVFNETVAWMARNNRECQTLLREQLANPELVDQDGETDEMSPCVNHEILMRQLAASAERTE